MWRCEWSAAAVVEALLGFGGNLGDPIASIGKALARLEAGGVRVLRRSHFYRTAPWGVTDQPEFVNLCAAAETGLAPGELLALIHRIEAELGRERREPWGPRLIDIDILAYGDETVEEPGLAIPHPRLAERAFVLVPLAEIAPERVIAGRTVREWAEAVDRSGVEQISPLSSRGSRSENPGPTTTRGA
jgi:2-amino-4-hydroxy-6-hydroxymethyldihydropteridine diphosphokinase